LGLFPPAEEAIATTMPIIANMFHSRVQQSYQ
jgi:hypothetical protein